MTQDNHDGVSQVMIERFVKYRLPVILQMLEEVDAGKKLSDGEIEVLTRALANADMIMKYAHLYPEFQHLFAQVINAYERITELALENEQLSPDGRTE